DTDFVSGGKKRFASVGGVICGCIFCRNVYIEKVYGRKYDYVHLNLGFRIKGNKEPKQWRKSVTPWKSTNC
ncbi:MAG: hypothetical protein ACLFUY_04725, partial [Desulfobacterales bacterium]